MPALYWLSVSFSASRAAATAASSITACCSSTRKRDDFVLDLLEAAQARSADTQRRSPRRRRGLAATCARRRPPSNSVSASCGTDRPDAVRSADQMAEGAAGILVRAAQCEIGKVGCFGDADLRVGRGHLCVRPRPRPAAVSSKCRGHARGHRRYIACASPSGRARRMPVA